MTESASRTAADGQLTESPETEKPRRRKRSILARIRAIDAKLNKLLRKTRNADCRFVGIADAARRADLSPESIRRLISAGKLTAFRPVRGRVVVDVRALDSFVLNATAQPRIGRGRTRHT